MSGSKSAMYHPYRRPANMSSRSYQVGYPTQVPSNPRSLSNNQMFSAFISQAPSSTAQPSMGSSASSGFDALTSFPLDPAAFSALDGHQWAYEQETRAFLTGPFSYDNPGQWSAGPTYPSQSDSLPSSSSNFPLFASDTSGLSPGTRSAYTADSPAHNYPSPVASTHRTPPHSPNPIPSFLTSQVSPMHPAPAPTVPIPSGSLLAQSPQYLTPQNTGTMVRGGSIPRSTSSSSSTHSKKTYSADEARTLFNNAASLPGPANAGPVIPQMMYRPHTRSDRKRYVEEIVFDQPLYFELRGPTEYGLPLSDALHERTQRLKDKDKPVFDTEDRGPSVSIRLEWPGYRQWTRQIPTKDFRATPGPITLGKLAKNIAKCVQRFISENETRMPDDPQKNRRWKVGTGPNEIRLEDLMLVSLHHVSRGSWQPHIRLRNSSMPPVVYQNRHSHPLPLSNRFASHNTTTTTTRYNNDEHSIRQLEASTHGLGHFETPLLRS